MKSNLILTGMPGAGKSTVGVILAKVLGYDFVDIDILIAKRQGMPLQDIIDQRGVDAFLKIEEQEACLLETDKTIIATGGSVVLSDRAITHLKQIGTCVYLDIPLDVLEARLLNMKTRGIAANPGTTLEDIYKSRRPFYERHADHTIHCGTRSMEEVVAEIVSACTV